MEATCDLWKTIKRHMKIGNNIEEFESLGDDHVGTSSDTPLRNDAFKLSNEEKIDIIKNFMVLNFTI